MKYRYDYICKLITNLKKTRTINCDIIENDEKFTNTDIRYLILTILMNSGLLFEKKFSDNNWIINRNDYSSFCVWHGFDGNYTTIKEEPDFDEMEDEITDWSFLDEEPEEVLEEMDYYNQGDDYIISIFKDEDGKVSGTKLMNQIRNKLFHNQYSDYDFGIVLNFAEGELEIEDRDIYAILESYLKACINVKTIKQLLYSNGHFLNKNYLQEDKNSPNQFDVLKINEIISMFQFLYVTASENSKSLQYYSKLEESIFSFNNFLNAIDEINPFILSSISQPDFEKAQLSSLFSIIFVMSDIKRIDISALDFSFLTVKTGYSTDNNNIIRHIRNCFAHGYYTYQNDIIIINDYNNGVETFSAECSITDFINFSLSEGVLSKMYDTKNNVSFKK